MNKKKIELKSVANVLLPLILALLVLGFFVYKALNQSRAGVFWFLLFVGAYLAVCVYGLVTEGTWIG